MTSDVAPAAIQAELDRILASETFRGAERSRALLRFIVEEATQGRADRLKDYVLGAEALGRGEKFDPRTDPVARVEASRLRSRLEVYYANEGATDPLRISLPKGGYAPAFDARHIETATKERHADQPQMRARGRRTRTSIVYTSAAGLALVAIAATIGWQLGRHDLPMAQEQRFDLSLDATTDSVSLALSPNGQWLAYVASLGGRPRLWLRSLQSGDTHLLAGTEDATLPFWKPDGRSIGFFADRRIKRIDLDTGLIHIVSTAIVPAGAAWNSDDVVLHPMVPDSPLLRTSIGDNMPDRPATELLPGQTGHRGPVFLPDGRHFLFHASGAPAVSGVYVGALGTTAIRRLIEADAAPVVASPDRILYVRDSTLFMDRLEIDANGVRLAGSPRRLTDDISAHALFGIAAISASADTIIYRTGSLAGKRQLMWIDRDGNEVARIGSPESRGGSGIALAPDLQHLALERTAAGNTDIVIMDTVSGTFTPFTTDRLPEVAPQWSPDGKRIVYSALRNGNFQLFEKTLGGEPQLLLDTPEMKQITDWSRDDKYILFRTVNPARFDLDIWALRLSDRTALPVVRTQFEERDAQFSPDGKFIAYQSNSTGQAEIYVTPFGEDAEPDRISKDGGVQVRWQHDGLGLYYLNLHGQLVNVSLTRGADGRSLRPGKSVTLFRASSGPLQSIAQQSYQPSADGTKFLMDVVIEETPSPIRVILNWQR